ncbi:MAG: hypothetical protein N4A74_16195 [Carboxylicivirga sp.]|nr:hypothetical protein [Carboxylicivirga sp.]
MRYLFFIMILFVCINTQAQEYFATPEFRKFWQNLDHLKSLESDDAVNYKGSPYIYESEKASLSLSNNEQIKGLTLRYNIYNDRMEIKKDQQFYNVPREAFIKSILLDGHLFKLIIYRSGNKKKTTYCEVMVEDSLCSLYLKHKIILKQAEDPKPYQDAKPPEFKRVNPLLYISIHQKPAVLVASKNDFIDLMPNHKAEIARYIKKNKVKFKKPDSVKQLVEYYNSL